MTYCKTRTYEEYKRLKEDREDVKDDDRPKSHRTSTTDDNVEQWERRK